LSCAAARGDHIESARRGARTNLRDLSSEYGLLGIISGMLAIGIGTAAAWLIARNVFELPFAFDLGAAVLIVLGRRAATWQWVWLVLGRRSAPDPSANCESNKQD
jgi:predicted lysophospholipase L1 biosynthesis ABC-type transport system permease subunit